MFTVQNTRNPNALCNAPCNAPNALCGVLSRRSAKNIRKSMLAGAV